MIFVDMDGVVADFDRGIIAKYGCPMEELPKQHMNKFWDDDCVECYFFTHLDPIKEGFKLVMRLAKEKIPFSFLTSTGGGINHWKIAKQKLEFLDRWLSPRVFPVAFCASTAGKAQFASGPSSFLIDDRTKVVDAWQAAGGTARLFTPENWLEIANDAVSHHAGETK